ncbi:MAG: type VI secretion system protein TssA [Blastocatellia bacterium]
MPVPAVADVEKLLVPIPGENPAGESLLYEGTYDRIKTARRADDVLAQGEWQRELKVADWPKVIQLATEALTTRTKDLQIAAWLTEALVKNDRLDRLAGLRDGLQLLGGLLAGFWVQLFPAIDPEDDEGPLNARANVIADLEGRLAVALTEIPVTRGTAGVNYSYAQWEESRQFDVPENPDSLPYDEQTRVSELRARAAAERKITSEDWRRVYRTTPRAFYEERLELAVECRTALKSFDQIVDEYFGREAPGLRSLDKALDNLHTMLERMVKDKRLAEPWPEDEQAVAAEDALPEDGADGAAAPALARSLSGPVRSRQEALQRLSEVADYFRQAEPHSPVSYLVQRAVRWGEMPLENWLGEVIKDSSVLEQLREMLGIRSESE